MLCMHDTSIRFDEGCRPSLSAVVKSDFHSGLPFTPHITVLKSYSTPVRSILVDCSGTGQHDRELQDCGHRI